ncbi:hypothetical protein M3182_16830 [Mesobacillus maritimus]|uniref:hypothetical protein n=1 Tax=Mesobacillus maritimus TaxID=1643336 RepID=UPI00203C689D|nr:hypothetical protein [Mesobacillus maritimus]MCM3587404.1 hypothetical protein [Mesobacillus maritimus]MCM3667964.1 hypothetical protein [Mesobacillus maritimus]
MLSKELLMELEQYVQTYQQIDFELVTSAELELYSDSPLQEELQQIELEAFIEARRKPTFSQVLFRYIDQTAARDADIYKKAGIDRKLFSKIRSIPNYQPRKNTVLSLAFALKLDYDDVVELLGAAGYSFSDSDTQDLVLQFCIEKKIFDLDYINQALEYFSLKPLR